MEALASVTPPPPTNRVCTPPAPRFGFLDNYEPYPRRSARLSQHSVNRTPSPRLPSRHFVDSDPESFGSPRSKKQPRTTTTMTSPGASPQKKRLPKMDSVRRASGTITAESTAQAAAALGLSAPPAEKRTQITRAATSSAASMLPTPAKTPQKPPTEQEKANIAAIARKIFSSEDEAMPQSKKSSTSHHVLDSFAAVTAEESFEIFTDSTDRVPKVDNSLENPFFGTGAAVAQTARRRSTRKPHMVTVPGEGRLEIQDAVGREDGMVYNFRGKKGYVTFADKDEVAAEDEAGNRSPSRRSTRSMKPRLLFPREDDTEPEQERNEEDEEAMTDIEDHNLSNEKIEDAEPKTPFETVDATPDTPATPRFAPASPPTTARVTRFGAKSNAEGTPMKGASTRDGSQSPFKTWQVSKRGSAKHGMKRHGKPIQDAPAKRTRA